MLVQDVTSEISKPESHSVPPLLIRLASETISSMSAFSASVRSSMRLLSILLQMTRMGLLENRGLIEWNSAAC